MDLRELPIGRAMNKCSTCFGLGGGVGAMLYWIQNIYVLKQQVSITEMLGNFFFFLVCGFLFIV